ncbi:MAG: hypothetical protein PHY73_04730 [Candidatus Omnitrophica bacterium]|nr:hypothetical protein [Candidatus Omnitrophota bacterium]
MRDFFNYLRIFIFLIVAIGFIGCDANAAKRKRPKSFSVLEVEAQWIQDGKPILFEDELWYPKDDIDILSDSEVYLLGEQDGVQFFVGTIDVRPYNRIYTKFEKNKFRIFEKK